MDASWSFRKRRYCAPGSTFPRFRVTRSRFAASETCSPSGPWPARVICPRAPFPSLRSSRLPPCNAPLRFPPPRAGGLCWGRQQTLDLGGDSLVARGDLRWPGAGKLAVRADQVFVKVPAWRACLAEFCRNPLIKRMSFAADDSTFLGERKVDRITGSAEALDLGGRSRLLRPEIV